ncbi:MAG: UDP-glucose 4-epimerase GalE [Chitinophagales bacterium]|nr:UDP-glucose 4-epimerase GalE [Chitinophagales bacterium]
MDKVIVTGGCGYIGAHTIVDLISKDYYVISIDDNSKSDPKILEGIQQITGKKVKNYQVDLKDKKALFEVLNKHKDAMGIIHFAAYKSVPESVEKPLKYYSNNLIGLTNLLEGVSKFEIPNFVFSSSCSVYGNVEKLPVSEDTPMGVAESPYARTKQMGEDILRDYVKSFDGTNNKAVNVVLLRYFNPVGAHPSGIIGEIPLGVPNNLTPFITQTAIGIREKVTVFGNDYATRDGSGLRDYIHVMDIADAHTKALQYLKEKPLTQNPEVFNLGTGNGVTVLEMIKAFEKVSGKSLNYVIGPRRPGDIEAIYADNQKAIKELGWKIQYNIDDMMEAAWKWEQKFRRG